MSNKPVIVLTGHVGVGKSFIMEKLTGLKGLSSSHKHSFTTESIWSETDEFIVIDTPGINPRSKFRFGHNMAVADAFSFSPISILFIVITALERIDATIDSLADQYSRYFHFSSIICPMVTKMDTVKEWTEADFLKELRDEIGIERAVFSNKDKDPKALITEITNQCKDPMAIDIKSDDFLRYFKIDNMKKIKALTKTQQIVEDFKESNKIFFHNLDSVSGDDKSDMLFQYQHFMLDMIDQCKQELTESCGLDFLGENMTHDLGYVANLTSQLTSVLYDVRMMTLGYQRDNGVTNLRKCPHCGLIWTNVIGCDGETSCGRLVKQNESRGEYATFSFTFRPFSIKKLSKIRKVGEDANTVSPTMHAINTLRGSTIGEIIGAGCGKKIVWANMAPIKLPEEFDNVNRIISVADMSVLPNSSTIESEWQNKFEEESRKHV